MRHLFVAADVKRAHDQWPAAERLDHRAMSGELVLLARRFAAIQEEELGAHQPDSLGTLRQGEGGLVGQVDVSRDLDAVAVAGGRRLGAQRRLPRALLALRGHEGACGGEVVLAGARRATSA